MEPICLLFCFTMFMPFRFVMAGAGSVPVGQQGFQFPSTPSVPRFDARHLQSGESILCERAIEFVSGILQNNYQATFGCTCSTSIVTCQSGPSLCGGYSGILWETVKFSSTGAATDWNDLCFDFDDSSDNGLLSGERFCHRFLYCGSQFACSCSSSLSGQECTSCGICTAFPFEVPQNATFIQRDCGNLDILFDNLLSTKACSEYTSLQDIRTQPLSPCFVTDYVETASPTDTFMTESPPPPTADIQQPPPPTGANSGENGSSATIVAAISASAAVVVAALLVVGVFVWKRRSPSENVSAVKANNDLGPYDHTTTGVEDTSHSVRQQQGSHEPLELEPVTAVAEVLGPAVHRNPLPDFKDQARSHPLEERDSSRHSKSKYTDGPEGNEAPALRRNPQPDFKDQARSQPLDQSITRHSKSMYADGHAKQRTVLGDDADTDRRNFDHPVPSLPPGRPGPSWTGLYQPHGTGENPPTRRNRPDP